MLSLLLWSMCGVLALWLYWRIKHKRLIDAASNLPGPVPLPIIGNALRFLCRPEELAQVIKDLTVDYGDVMRFWLGPDLNIVVSDPDDLKILLTSAKTTHKGTQYKYMADVLGGGILSGSGPTWRKHRKIANPNYGKRAVEGYTTVINEEVKFLLKKLKTAPHGKEYNIYENIVQTTSYTVCQTLMGLSREETLSLPNLQAVIDKSPRLYDIVFGRMTKWWYQIDPVFWMTKSYRDQMEFIHLTREFSLAIIKYRARTLHYLEENKKNLLMNSEEDDCSNTLLSVIDRFILSNVFSDQELVHETFTVFTSSQEASAKISSFLLLMMAYHQDNQERLYQEIMDVIGDANVQIDDEHLKRMPYLEMVFKEILRLFPIGAILQRSVLEDVAISKSVLPAGSSLVIPIYHLQRDSRHWENPQAFDPERFNPENTKKRHPYAYIPFSLGAMDCLGRHFGTKLIKTIAIQVLKNYKVSSLETYNDMKIGIAVSVTSIKGFKVILTPRKK